MPPTFDDLREAFRWQPIYGCPGRFVLRGAHQVRPADLMGSTAQWSRHRVPSAVDEVLVCRLADGGVISFQRADGSIVHTLNTKAGFARRLQKLGLLP